MEDVIKRRDVEEIKFQQEENMMKIEENIVDPKQHILSAKERKIDDPHPNGVQTSKFLLQTLNVPTATLGLSSQETQTLVSHIELFLSCFSTDEIHVLHTSIAREIRHRFEVVLLEWRSSLSEKEAL